MRIDRTARWADDRVELFALEPKHVTPAYVSWVNDPEVNRFLESRFVQQTEDSVRQFVEAAARDQHGLFWGIRSVALDRHVGNIKLAPIDRHHLRGEVGIMIGDRDAWGLGIGSRALALVSAIADRDLGLRKLTAGCYASNIGSVRAFERAGYTVEAVRPAHFLLEGRPEDFILMGRVLKPAS